MSTPAFRLSTARGRIPSVLTPAQFAWLRAALFAAALLPLARLFYLGFTDGLGANPIEFVIRSLGTWTLVLLIVTLSVTPLRLATGWAWLARLRRMFGLFCFFYAALHFSAYFWLDQWFDLNAIWKDIVKRPYITIGFTAFVLLIPLAVTSTNAMVRRLGGKNWQRLHRLVYVIAIAGALHFWWQRASKNNIAEPMLYALVIAALLAVRVVRRLRERTSATTRLSRSTVNPRSGVQAGHDGRAQSPTSGSE